MALYIDSAFLHDIMEVAETIPVAGVTTNPTILLAARERGQNLSPHNVLSELLRSINGTMFMQPGATEDEKMYQEALTYIQVEPHRVIPKIPMTQIGMRVARRLKQQQYRIAFTAVTSISQAYSAAMVSSFLITDALSVQESMRLIEFQRWPMCCIMPVRQPEFSLPASNRVKMPLAHY